MSQSVLSPVDSFSRAGTGEIGALTDKEFSSFRALVLDWTGITLSDNKRELLYSRLTKRLRHFGFRAFQEYYDFVVDPSNKGEKQELINCITTNKTDFFREMHHFDFLKNTVFPKLRDQARKTGSRKVRIWCSASSTGEEPYSIAITLQDWFRNEGAWTFDLVASDIDTVCLRTAKEGIYEESRVSPLTTDQKSRYLLKGKGDLAGKVAVKPELRQMIDYRQLNLVKDPLKFDEPFDVIFCRNVMIYFNRDTQRVLVDKFANALRPEGYLIIGHSETLHEISDRFEPIGKTIYQLTGKDGATPAAKDGVMPTVKAGAKPAAKVGAKPAPKVAATPAAPPREGPKTPVAFVKPTLDPSGENLPNHAIIVGELHASREPACVSTVLGSCVAACLFDPQMKIGGMNHFLLPDGDSAHSSPSCYGIHAMELLINEILKLGGDRRRLQAKIFGGAQIHAMTDSKLNIGRRNVEFVREFLKTEGIQIVGERVGGPTGVKVCFHTHSARAFVKPVGGSSIRSLIDQEKQRVRQAPTAMEPKADDLLTFF